MYTIGQVAEMFDLPISTLRYYDKQGLFPNMERMSGIRKFGDTEIEALRVIECLKKAGMEIKDIRQFMDWCAEGPATYPQRKAMFEERKAHMESEIAHMNRALDMASSMKEHLKKHFPNAKCDLCNAFILQCIDKIQTGGTIGLVTQSSWMYLDSFENLRRELITNNTIESIADLGSGAFYDLSGEKANVALVRVTKTPYANACVKVLTLRDIPLKEKAAVLGKASDSVLLMQQTQLFGGEHMAFSLSQTTPNTVHAMPGKYGDYGIPMQGTSTGDAARLIGYYWEHLNDPEWVPVSKGGSYSRWCGLNSYVLKWGADGEYIRTTKGSALRNTKYFDRTSLVYSDTGTSGFNARLLEEGQLFVASGPGIRDVQGSPYAHLSLLNSRVFSYYLRALSPKLTVAAGYISRVPVPTGLLDRIELNSLGRECYDRKREQLKVRPNNLEWQVPVIEFASLDAFVWQLFLKEMQDELVKLSCEKKLDDIILEAYALDKAELSKLNETVGVPAIDITGTSIANKLDKVMAQALDANCQIVRTRVNKQSLGCDGLLEFIARKEQVSPELIVELISSSPETFEECKAKYKNLVLHNIVLAILGFRVETRDEMQMLQLCQKFYEMYPGLKNEWDTVEELSYGIFPRPCHIQPAGFFHGAAQLLPHLRLRFAKHVLGDALAGDRIVPCGVAPLPAAILSLADIPFAIGAFLGH